MNNRYIPLEMQVDTISVIFIMTKCYIWDDIQNIPSVVILYLPFILEPVNTIRNYKLFCKFWFESEKTWF